MNFRARFSSFSPPAPFHCFSSVPPVPSCSCRPTSSRPRIRSDTFLTARTVGECRLAAQRHQRDRSQRDAVAQRGSGHQGFQRAVLDPGVDLVRGSLVLHAAHGGSLASHFAIGNGLNQHFWIELRGEWDS